jgi:hypothetical protein
MKGFILPVMTLCWREVVRFCRQRSRLVDTALFYKDAKSGNLPQPSSYRDQSRKRNCPDPLRIVCY